MTNINFETYFIENENKYYDPKVIISILEDFLGKPINELKKDVNDNQIVVTKEQIENYLKQKFIEEDPELKKRIESPRPKRSSNIAEWTKQDIEDSAQEFVDDISVGRYCFEPYTLEYFNKYITIVRNKANLLLNLIEKIGNKDSQTIQEMLTELDITLDENGNILKSDIIRLITPTVYNINDLNKILLKANDLSTYLTFKMSKHSLYRNGLSEGEIYPTQSIQIKDLYHDYIKGNVSLSENQKSLLRKQQSRSIKKLVKMLPDLK